MGQLLNRIKNFARAQFNNHESQQAIIDDLDEDDELKKLIDEAARQSGKDTNTGKENDSKNYSPEIKSEADACRILGIELSTAPDKIKSAYKEMMKKYHPDKVSGLGDEIKHVAEMKSVEINQAFEFLRKKRNF